MNNKINKTAYPQGHSIDYIESYDVNKWVKTLETMYLYANQGYDISKTREQLTENWDSMEKNDFNHWVKYYQSNSQDSYKTAQFLPGMQVADSNYLAVAPGAIVPNKAPLNDLKPNIKLPEEDDPQFKINKKIKSIISRLLSAEKLATDPDVQRELSKRLDIGIHKWLEELQRVKRLVQVAPIRHASSTILEDLIIKEANVLAYHGFPKAARELIKIAQDPAAAPLPPPPPPMPTDAGAIPPPPGVTPPPAGPGGPVPEPTKPGEDPALNQVAELLKIQNSADDGMVKDDELEADIEISEFSFDDSEIVDMLEGTDPISNNMVVMAQVAEPMPSAPEATDVEPLEPLTPAPVAAKPPVPVKPAVKPEIEIVDEPADTLVHKRTDDLLEQALSGVTINDIIERLDTLVNLFRTREIPRQLAIIDLMMDQLNLSSFFPGLAEASSKSLESNQYALTRIEEVLSKLKGSLKNPKERELDLLGKETSTSPEAFDLDGMRASLQEQEDKDKARKQQRKVEEQAKVEKPAIEIEEDLAQPVALPEVTPEPTAPKAPLKPPAPAV